MPRGTFCLNPCTHLCMYTWNMEQGYKRIPLQFYLKLNCLYFARKRSFLFQHSFAQVLFANICNNFIMKLCFFSRSRCVLFLRFHSRLQIFNSHFKKYRIEKSLDHFSWSSCNPRNREKKDDSILYSECENTQKIYVFCCSFLFRRKYTYVNKVLCTHSKYPIIFLLPPPHQPLGFFGYHCIIIVVVVVIVSIQ